MAAAREDGAPFQRGGPQARGIGATDRWRARDIAWLHWRIACIGCAAMRKQHRIPILIALVAAVTSGACNGVIVQGAVLDEDTFVGVPNAIVTYTSTTTLVTYNDTSVAPGGDYSINLIEDTYIVQVVAPGCGGPPAVTVPLTFQLSAYTIDLFVDCP